MDRRGRTALPARILHPPFGALLLAVLAAAVSAPVADCWFPLNDEGALLTNAARILRGAVFYRDLDAYPFPAPTYLLAAAMGLLGEDVAVARGLAAAIYVAVALGLYACAVQVLPRSRAALVALLLLGCKGWAWPAFTSYFYSDVAFLGAVGATACLLRFGSVGRGAWLALAGIGTALSILSKQSLGLLLAALFGGLLLLPGVRPGLPGLARMAPARRASCFALAAAAPCLLALAYFAWHGVAGHMLESGLLRPFTGYLPTSAIPFGPMLQWWEAGSLGWFWGAPYIATPLWNLIAKTTFSSAAAERISWLGAELASRALYSSVPLLLAWAGLRMARELWTGRRLRADTEACLPIAALALAATGSAFPRADFFHVMSVYPALVLLWMALRARRPVSRVEAGAVAALAAGGLLLLAALVQRLDQRVELERGRLWVEDASRWPGPLVRELQAVVPPGESFFVYGSEATLYFLADRYFPWPFAQLYPGQAGNDGGRALAEILRRERPRIVVRGIPRWPGLPPLPEYTPLLRDEIHKGWQRDLSDVERGLVPGEPGQPPLIAVYRRRPRRARPGATRLPTSGGQRPPASAGRTARSSTSRSRAAPRGTRGVPSSP
jgi:hypothetical protein